MVKYLFNGIPIFDYQFDSIVESVFRRRAEICEIIINNKTVNIWFDGLNSIRCSNITITIDHVIEYVKSSPCGCCRP